MITVGIENAMLDLLVLTAANESQAAGYRAQLAARRDLPARETLVVSDPGGRRAGSGASTFLVLDQVLRRARASRVDDRSTVGRVLVLHSGGDSRRLPAYSAQGKIFAPLHATDTQGRRLTLLDLIVADMAPLVPQNTVVIGAGDAFLDLRRHAPDLRGEGVRGLAFPAGMGTASGHGVYVLDRGGKVRDFLQKPTRAFATSRGAIRRDGRLLIDSGVLAFSGLAVGATLLAAKTLLARIGQGRVFLDLYEHVAMAMAPRVDEAEYIRRVGASSGLNAEEVRRLYRSLRSIPFDAMEIPNCEFLHFGTTREYLESGRRDLSGFAGVWKSVHLARPAPIADACDPGARIRLRHGNLIVNAPPLRSNISLPRGFGVVFLPTGRRHWAAVLFSDQDSFKRPLAAEGPGSVASLVVRRADGCVAPSADGSLWHASLWIEGTPDASYRHAAALLRPGPLPAAWLRGTRRSLADLMLRVEHSRLSQHRSALDARDRVMTFPESLREYPAMRSTIVVADFATRPAEGRRALRRLARAIATERDDSHAARLLRIAELCGSANPDLARRAGLVHPPKLHRMTFAAVSRTVDRRAKPAERPTRPGALPEQIVWVTMPARIDLAGGWSDTPPICVDLGGTVLNAAVTLNDQYPIQVVCRLHREPTVRLSSIDLGRSITFRSARDLQRFDDPLDWAALPKAAMYASGLIPDRLGERLADWLSPLSRDGGTVGIDLTVFSALPKGSGLGGSSILGAAILAGLGRLSGRPLATEELIRRTSLLEQLMSTGGGWQDQAGAVLPGVKLLRTQAGPVQDPLVTPVDVSATLDSAAGRGRLLLFYTGQRRLARNILRNVVLRYLDRDPEAMAVLHRLKRGAEEMRAALGAGDLDGFGSLLLEYWTLKQRLDPGASTPGIEAILSAARPYLSAWGLPGAGGGGFVLMLARDEDAAGQVRRVLTRRAPSSLARFYDFRVDHRGLCVTSL